MNYNHTYYTSPELYYQTKHSLISLANFNLTIEEIQDLDQCIDLQCKLLEQSPIPEMKQQIMEDLCPYFARVWDCAINLSQWCYTKDELFKNKKILEVGAGLAIPSFILKHLGHEITATDYHPHAHYFAHKNQSLNKLYFPYFISSWKELITNNAGYDIILASDILYEGRYIADLLQLTLNILNDGGKVIICDPIRGYLQKFIDEASPFFKIQLDTIKTATHENFLLLMERR